MTAGKRKYTKFGKDRRRKHHHWSVTVYYGDGDTFQRVYADLERAAGSQSGRRNLRS
jgi:hypothetical protein